ncbi:MAG: hypothetical protein DI628_06130 [Blastochloris viridis]|uniref:HAD family hydrolase n=1 Tax=Blastochloris viridis TaxID=1079 RepID=A0A6N4QY93_BLAVI|nr:MAG: hypothetical protein DI628_06130 [Blastochloris viridis]
MPVNTLIVFDMDGVIAEESEAFSLAPFYDGIHAIVAKHMPDLALDDAFRQICYDAYVEHGCCLKSLWAPKLGMTLDWVLESYRWINVEHLLPAVTTALQPKPSQVEKAIHLASLPHVTTVCLSQGHSDYVTGLLAHMGWLGPVIRPRDVHDIVSVGGHLKRTEEPYIYIRRCYPDYARYVMIEDTSLNLPPAKRQNFETHFCGMKMVHRDAFPFIDFHHLDTDRVLDHLIANI